MDYFGIVKHAFKLTLKNKFLWIFGILAGGSAGFSGMNFNMPMTSSSSANWSKMFDNSGSTFDYASFWANYGVMILILLVIFGLISIVFFILNLVSQAALVKSVEKIDKQEKIDFYIGFNKGWHQFWRIWGMNLIFLFIILASLVVLIVPVAVLVMAGQYVIAIILGILLFVICLALWILIGFISPYSLRVLVLKKLSIFDSIRESLHLVRDNLGSVIVMYLLLWAISMGLGILIALAAMLAIGLLLVIGVGIWYLSHIAALIFGILIGFAFFVTTIVLSGAYSSFFSSTLTLTYIKLSTRD